MASAQTGKRYFVPGGVAEFIVTKGGSGELRCAEAPLQMRGGDESGATVDTNGMEAVALGKRYRAEETGSEGLVGNADGDQLELGQIVTERRGPDVHQPSERRDLREGGRWLELQLDNALWTRRGRVANRDVHVSRVGGRGLGEPRSDEGQRRKRDEVDQDRPAHGAGQRRPARLGGQTGCQCIRCGSW